MRSFLRCIKRPEFLYIYISIYIVNILLLFFIVCFFFVFINSMRHLSVYNEIEIEHIIFQFIVEKKTSHLC